MLHRAAAKSGRALSYRVIVSNFDAALRVVAANLGISVIPFQASLMHGARGEIKVIPLTDAWAKRRFAVCFRDQASLSPAAARMVAFLGGKASA